MTRAAIKHSEERLREAMLASDVTALDSLIDDALVFLAPDGTVARKQDDLERHRTGVQKLTKIETREFLIEVLSADIAVVSVLADLAGSIHDQPFEGTFRYLRTWRRVDDEGTWRIISGAVMATTTA